MLVVCHTQTIEPIHLKISETVVTVAKDMDPDENKFDARLVI